MHDTRIEPVPPAMQKQAVRFLIAASRRDAAVEAQADVFAKATIGRYPQRSMLWWARRGRRLLAAAMIFENIGRTGIIFCTPADAEGADRAALVELVRTISLHALSQGLSLVQALLAPGHDEDVRMLRQAGYVPLAELIYMRRPIHEPPPSPPDRPDLAWRHHGQFDESQLADVIRGTYEQSLDCPALEGVRRLADVIAGHKATGVFSPDSWWIVDRLGAPAGCILVNEASSGASCEVVYMGVLPEHRGRGVGRAMIRRALAYAAARGFGSLTLAVDSHNAPALRLYQAELFVEVERRAALAMLSRHQAKGS